MRHAHKTRRTPTYFPYVSCNRFEAEKMIVWLYYFSTMYLFSFHKIDEDEIKFFEFGRRHSKNEK